MLGAYVKSEKRILVNKEGVLKAFDGEFSVRDKTKENEDIIVLYGQEEVEELISLIMENEPEHRISICLLIQATMNSFNNYIVRETFLKLKEVNTPLFNELKKVGVLEHVGIKNKWKFW